VKPRSCAKNSKKSSQNRRRGKFAMGCVQVYVTSKIANYGCVLVLRGRRIQAKQIANLSYPVEKSISGRSGFLVSLWPQKSQEQQKSQEKPKHIHTKQL